MDSTSINTDQFLEKGVTAFQFLSFSECIMLRNELATHQFNNAEGEVGPRKVKQYFHEADLIPSIAPKTMDKLRTLEERISRSIRFPESFIFNEFRLQKYAPPLEYGVGIHRDSRRFQYVVAVIVLELGGKLYICDDEMGNNPVEAPATLGSCILMRGYIQNQPDLRPYHYVANVSAPRFTIGCRYDSKLV